MSEINTATDNTALNGSFSFNYSQLAENIFKDMPANIANSASSLRTMLFSLLEKASNLPPATPILAKVTGEFLSTTAFSSIGIAIKAQDKGWCEATVTVFTGNTIAGTIAAKYVIPTVSKLPAGKAIVVGAIAVALLYTAVDKMVTNSYENITGKNIDFTFDEVNQKLLFGTDIMDLDTLKLLASSFEFYGNTGEDIKISSISFNIKNGNENLIYDISKGDTIYGLCDKYDIDLEELLKLNPWLRDRFSEDGKFALIRPGEKLRIPLNNKTELLEYNPTYNKWVEIAGDVAKIVDPMFLDLNGDGKMGTTSLENGINFDHAKDGFKELSAWVDKEDGILVIDKNENGIIDDGSEIFGDNYIKSNGNKAANGFEALTDLDSNKDGIINSSDKEFDKIKVLKGDGTLVSLTELGIVSISLNKTTVNEADENGNVLVYKGTYTKEDGTTGSLGTFNLIVDKMMSEEVNKVEVSKDVVSLPNIKGYGTVHSLHQAMMLDETGELKGLVQSFVNTEDIKTKKEILLDILHKWTKTENIKDGSRGSNFDAKRLHIIEQFMGQGFVGTDGKKDPNNNAAYYLSNAFNTLFNEIYARLQAQTELKEVFDLVDMVYDFDTDKVLYDLTKVQEYIDNVILEDETKGKALLGDFATTFAGLGLRNLSNYEEFSSHYAGLREEYGFIVKEAVGKVIINGTEDADSIEGTYMFEAIFGNNGSDTILSGDGDDFVFGGEGDDYINGGDGNDILYGGDGNDTIMGGDGDKICHDTIYGGNGDDVLYPSAIGGSTVYGGAGNDTIRGLPNRYDHGEPWYIDGGDGDDYIEGNGGANILIGGAGNDKIYTGIGNDTVYGGDGDDYIEVAAGENHIYGDDGNDTIIFRSYTGHSTITGGKGDDSITVELGQYPTANSKVRGTFIYNLGDGNDTINNLWNFEAIEFGEGITTENIRFTGVNTSQLLIFFEGHEGSIRIPGGASGGSNIPDLFRFTDGTTWSLWDALARLGIHGTEGDDLIEGSMASENIFGYGGNDTIKTGLGNDIVYAGDGNDLISVSGGGKKIIYGEGGNDTIHSGSDLSLIDGGDGDDYIETCSYGTNSTFIGGRGNDTIEVSRQHYAQSGAVVKVLIKYNLGDGDDKINIGAGVQATLEFGEGITTENILIKRGNDLLINFKDNEGSVRILRGAYNLVKTYIFADGTTLTHDQMIELMNAQKAAEAEQILTSKTDVENIALGTNINDEADMLYMPDFNVNKIVQDMCAYNSSEDIITSYSNNIEQEKAFMNLVNSSM